ncbi:MAG: hypothetical protein LW721_03975 [Flammeovirgaceae bacterium]|jgi:hypothetical protein|nr:hypothetical protein [Flammeovirgaceae bacterium]
MSGTLTDKKEEIQNVYARNVNGDEIHISTATSGRKGYFCLGCERAMQAVKHQKINHVDYFRHDAKAVANLPKCTYSDESHRHKIAKEILQRIKRIKVPALYKYPPKKQVGLANLLDESKFIEAYTVRNELTFYEDEFGTIRYGNSKDVKIDERYLTVRPDVTFFNNKDEPKLFIEIIATHGIKVDKLVKLKRLGIDTVQVTIPKDSPENIEKCFFTTDRTKWVYNNVEERTEYLPIALRSPEGVSQIDELQRKLFEETFSCRASEIGNLVRTITRCLESKPYRESENGFREEITRVERNTESNRTRLAELRANCRSGIKRRLELENKSIDEQNRNLSIKEERLKAASEKLERGFTRKRKEIIDKDFRFEIDGTGEGINLERRKGEIYQEGERAIKDFIEKGERRIRDIESTQARLREDNDRIQGEIRQLHLRIENNINSRTSISARFGKLKRDTSRKNEENESREVREIEAISRATTDESGKFEKLANGIREEFERLRSESRRTIETRDVGGNSELSRRISLLFQTRGRIFDYEKDYQSFKRNREAWDCFRTGAYKNWND